MLILINLNSTILRVLSYWGKIEMNNYKPVKWANFENREN
jgi:hypothetical protein